MLYWQIYEVPGLGTLTSRAADYIGRAVWGVGLRPLACWGCGFESRRGQGCLSVSCECCVLSGRGLCVGLIACPEGSYRMWCDWVWYRNFDKGGGLGRLGLSGHKSAILTDTTAKWLCVVTELSWHTCTEMLLLAYFINFCDDIFCIQGFGEETWGKETAWKT